MTEWETIAHAAIRRTLAACTMAGDARRADAYADSFTSDGVLDLARRIEGREAIRRWMAAPSVIPAPAADAGRAPGGYVSHHLTTCRIACDTPETATVRTYWLVVTAIGLDHSGYYDDRFRKVGDDWRIAWRRPRTLWRAADSLVGGAGRSGDGEERS